MVTLVFGIVVMVLMGGFFAYSLPRGGRSAWYVGSEWEGYIVVVMIGSFGVGLMFAVQGLIDVLA
jgi:hypothetical protein